MEVQLPFVNNIEDEEIIDFNLAEQQEIEPIEEIDDNLLDKSFFTIDSLFIVVFEENDGNLFDKLLIVEGFNEDSNIAELKDENQNDEQFLFDENGKLKYSYNGYKIIDVEKVEEFVEEIDEVELLHTSDIYPEIEIQVEEIKDKIYTIQEKKENLLNELIGFYNAYSDDTLIFQITDMVDQIINMYNLFEELPIDTSDTIEFIKNMFHQKEFILPKWLIPIVNNKKKLYTIDEDGDIEDNENTNIVKLENVLEEKHSLLSGLAEKTGDTNHYKKFMEIIFSDSFIPFTNNNGVTIPHHGTYLRDCDSKQCSGIKGILNFDMVRTRDKLMQPITKDGITNFESIVGKEQLSITGFLALSHMFMDITMSHNIFSLQELYFISDYKYSYITLKKRLKDVINHSISKNSVGEDINLKTFSHLYKLIDVNDYDDLSTTLKNNLLGYTNLINSIPKRIRLNIYNHSDFKKAYIGYGLQYSDLDNENRKVINDLIKSNIKNFISDYNRSVKRKVVKNIKKKKKLLTTKEKISLSRSYIMGLSNIPLRNNYLKKFINIFSRHPKASEDSNFLYEKTSDDKLLCKHYLYSINIHKDFESYNNLKSIYGGDVHDGFVVCKVCKEYICSDNFSLLEGFSDGVPKDTKEVLDTSGDEYKILTEKQNQIKKRIRKISSLFGVDLNQYDKQIIIDYYELFNNEAMIDIRYNRKEVFKNHPRIKEIKGSYKFIKPAKTQKDKSLNKKNKEKMTKDLKDMKEYFLDCNELFIDIFFILLLIQISNPSYPVNSSISINLWDFDSSQEWKDIQSNFLSNISIDTIELTSRLIQKIYTYNRKDKYWSNIKEFFFETSKYDDLPNFTQQFLSVTSYILKNNSIKDKLKNYFVNQKSNTTSLFTKDYWPTYKPFYDNKIVMNINQKVNSELESIKPFLMKSGGEYSYMNISTIRTFKDAYNTPRFKQLNIPFSEIMKNESYERLFKYSMQLYGVSKSIPIINLLIKRFIQTVKDDRVKVMLTKIGWDDSFKKVDKTTYSLFRSFFAVDLINHFQTKNPDDSDTLKIFFHFHVNNWNGLLLNSYPKRNYSYTPPTIYPDESFETLLNTEDEKNFVNELFDRHCSDEDGNIIERYNIDSFITNIIADPSIEREATCENNIPKTKENFFKILEYKRSLTKLPLYKPSITDDSIESRIKYFIRNNNYLERNADLLFPELRQLAYNKKCCSQEELRRIFNEISKTNAMSIKTIQDFFIDNQLIEKSQKDRFKTSFGRNITSLSVLLSRLLEDPEKLPQMIINNIQILSRLSIGESFNNHIPKQWKVSDTNMNYLMEFLSYNEFLDHYNIYIYRNKYVNEGFYKYIQESNHKLCFKALLDYIKPFFNTDYNTIIGNDDSKITREYSNIFLRYIYLFLFNLIIEYITNLQDSDSEVSYQANILFQSLEEQYRLELQDSITITTQFTFDLLVNNIEEFTDTNWIYQTQLLNDKLSRQREREKQGIIDNLESKTTDARLVTVEQQNCGLSNYFHEATRKNLSYTQTDEYKNALDNERSEFAKEFFSQHLSELEVMEGQGVDTNLLQPGQILPELDEQDEAYDQHDVDRESEGDDDGDDDGDYREN